jgi:hypothetical protein
MDLAAGLPLEADRTDMRYQWITRLLGNPLVLSDEIMESFAREVLEQAVTEGRAVQFCSEWVRGRAKRVYLVGEVA